MSVNVLMAEVPNAYKSAVRHLFQLVSGLESLVAGDAQILGQVKKAYQRAVEQGTVGKTLHTLFQKSFAVAKKVRSQTGLGKGRISISALAVDYVTQHIQNSKHIQDISALKITVIGAGKMGSLCIKYLSGQNWQEIHLINRTVEKCESYARDYGIRVSGFDKLEEVLTESDVVISATSSTEPVITKELFERVHQANSKTRMLVDIAVPQDIEEDIANMEYVTLTGLEELREVAAVHQTQRASAMQQAVEIINQELTALGSWPLPVYIDSVSVSIGEYANKVLEEEKSSLFDAAPDLTPEQKKLIEQKLQRIAERLVLAPRRILRESAPEKFTPETLQQLDEIFRSELPAVSADNHSK